jgi:hypothetical protein
MDDRQNHRPNIEVRLVKRGGFCTADRFVVDGVDWPVQTVTVEAAAMGATSITVKFMANAVAVVTDEEAA